MTGCVHPIDVHIVQQECRPADLAVIPRWRFRVRVPAGVVPSADRDPTVIDVEPRAFSRLTVRGARATLRLDAQDHGGREA